MMDRDKLEKWIAENGNGHRENRHYNGIDYLFVTMKDGWIAIFEIGDGVYLPRTQAADEGHAASWCAMRERLSVQVQMI